METIWLITTLLANGHVLETMTMDQRTCRKAEYYSAAGLPFQVQSNMGAIPVASATCRRIEACQDTGPQLALALLWIGLKQSAPERQRHVLPIIMEASK